MHIRFVLLVTCLLTMFGCSSRASLAFISGGVTLQDSRLKAPEAPKSTMQLSTYLLFDGDCKPAMEFYRSIFGGELTLTTVGESPMKGAFPPSLHSRVLNARLKSAFADISASDWLRPNEKRINGNTISFYLSGGTPTETTALFRKLSEGAEVTDPLSEQPFGLYGALTDKFGMRWRFHSRK